MNIDDIYRYMLKYQDIFLELDLHRLNYEKTVCVTKKILEAFCFNDSVLERCLMQVNTKDMFYAIKDCYNFKYIQYIVLNNYELLDEHIEFCTENNICSMAIKKKFASPEIIKKIQKAGLAILVFTVNDISLAKHFLSLGVNTICTDFILPNQVRDNYLKKIMVVSSQKIKKLFGRCRQK